MKPLLILALCATAWAGNGYTGSRLFTFNVHPASSLTAFPNLISGTYAEFADMAHGGYVQHTTTLNGQTVPADLIFTSDSAGTELLSWEVESWNNTTGAIVAWVRSDRSSSADTLVYAWVGKSSVTSYQCTASATWDTSYKGVWLMPNGITPSAIDSTANANNGTFEGSPNPPAVAGKMGGAIRFYGSATRHIMLPLPASDSLNITGETITIEAWFKLNQFPTGGGPAGFVFDSGGFGGGYGLYFIGDGGYYFAVHGVYSMPLVGAAIPTDTAWHHLAFTSTSGGYLFYVDGTLASSGSMYTIGSSAASTYHIGVNGSVASDDWSMSDLSIASTNRSADWFAHEVVQQGQGSPWYSVGAWTP